MAQLGFELTTSATPPSTALSVTSSTALSVTSTDCAIETTPLKDCSNIYIYIFLLNQRKEKRKYVARPGIEPRTSDLRVRCPTDCATRPGRRENTSSEILQESARSRYQTFSPDISALTKNAGVSHLILQSHWHTSICLETWESIFARSFMS